MGMACIANTFPAQKYSIRSTTSQSPAYALLPVLWYAFFSSCACQRILVLHTCNIPTLPQTRNWFGATCSAEQENPRQCVSAGSWWATPSFIHGAESSTPSKLQPTGGVGALIGLIWGRRGRVRGEKGGEGVTVSIMKLQRMSPFGLSRIVRTVGVCVRV